ARLVNRAHDSLIAANQFLDVHFGNEVDGGDGVVAGSVRAEQTAFAFESLPELGVWQCVQHSHHGHRNRALANELDLPFENIFGIVVEADDETAHYFHALIL